jgi:AraC-like DNA-binding protein
MAPLLSTTDLSIAESARSVGWADSNYASRRFRAHYGMSPTEFRRDHAEADHFPEPATSVKRPTTSTPACGTPVIGEGWAAPP